MCGNRERWEWQMLVTTSNIVAIKMAVNRESESEGVAACERGG